MKMGAHGAHFCFSLTLGKVAINWGNSIKLATKLQLCKKRQGKVTIFDKIS
jgi:hypothetical protein